MRTLLLRSTCLAALACFASAPAIAQSELTEAGELAAGDEQLETGEYSDTYTIEGAEGQLLEVEAMSDDFDAFLMVRGPGGAQFDNDDARDGTTNAAIMQRLPASGTYAITVTSFENGETGRYLLRAATSEAADASGISTQQAGTLENGDEQLNSGEFADAYTFDGRRGTAVHLTALSDDFDTYLMLSGPDGAVAQNDDPEAGGSDAVIDAVLPADGMYSVTVTSFEPGENGAYVLEAEGVASLVAKVGPAATIRAGGAGDTLTLGTPVAGMLEESDPVLEEGEHFDVWTVSADPGTRIAVRMQSGAFDSFLLAMDEDGVLGSNDDATDDSTDSALDVVVPASGRFTVAATSYAGDETGRYTLSADTVEGGGAVDVSQAEPLVLGQSVDGVLSAPQTYAFTIDDERDVEFLLTSDAFDPVLRIDGPGGFSQENDDDDRGGSRNSRIRTTLTAPGTYRLTVSSYRPAETGSFRLAAREGGSGDAASAAAVGTLALGQSVTGTLAAGDATFDDGSYGDVYTFEGHRGERVAFTMQSEDLDTYLVLTLPGGEREVNDDRIGEGDSTDSQLAVTLPEDGTYRITASSYGSGEAGDYTLSMAEPDPHTRTITPTGPAARIYALSVGVADYERASPLTMTDEDAQKLTELLRREGRLAPESVTLVNADATRENFVAAFDAIASAIKPDDLFLLFFSGHGDKIEGVTTEMDGSSETIELFDTPLHDYELREMFADVDARVLLVLDSCFSGGFDDVIDARVDRMGIFSSDSDVLSLVAAKFKAGGYVSPLLREALSGDADANADNAISAGELSEYMRRGFYRVALDSPLETEGRDFLGQRAMSYQHLVVDRGGDGMPYSQVLLQLGEPETAGVQMESVAVAAN
ncbi:pre-peptidase C-terminal domain-containing protein [Aurantiacibacter spongiae]|uniref:Peptidase C-terminal archaeal/bacterial domain-containing protein n=1 Tax=Aurantiacibacter spongiae TaxID=2488860 RepID=A0A3N5CRQ9_9SPHN|nr:pre-peptidase C-terminal domain-containing protein [Aurantiacibacter spongiae]RPF71036.1 hypothetical protein EG799_04970 [Aurantiacibacter spongiae]